jgi:curved DNA-binding protein CbpA
VNDYFAVLGEPRRPWIDPESLKPRFLTLSAQVHPDRTHSESESEKRASQQRYTELNAAYNCLRDPKTRLRHLLELERGTKPSDVETIPPGLMDLFLEVSGLCREADAFLAGKAAVTSPLLKVQIFERGQECTERLTDLQKRLNAQTADLTAELKAIDARWEPDAGSTSHTAALGRLEELYRLFSYFSRWSGQIQERIAQISF